MTLLLLEQGADLTKKNHAGVSPQELAAKSESMRQLLIGISNKKKRLLIFFFFFACSIQAETKAGGCTCPARYVGRAAASAICKQR